jgi:hypothetical protein
LRSRISDWACVGLFQNSGAWLSAFSSSRRLRATSQSKTPPEQSYGPLDVGGDGFKLGAHGMLLGLRHLAQSAGGVADGGT